jgi:hypothetical protein
MGKKHDESWYDAHEYFQDVLRRIALHREAMEEELYSDVLDGEALKELEYLYGIAEETCVVGSRGEWESPKDYPPPVRKGKESPREPQFFYVKNWTTKDWDKIEKIHYLFDEYGFLDHSEDPSLMDFKAALLARKAYKIMRKREKKFVRNHDLHQRLVKYEERTGRSSQMFVPWIAGVTE